MIYLSELLVPRGWNFAVSTKIVRHADPRIDLGRLLRTDRSLFEVYQADQAKDVFACRRIISLVHTNFGDLLAGVYQITGKTKGIHPRLAEVEAYCKPNCQLAPNKPADGGYIYSIDRLPEYQDLEERIVIGWGKNPRMWHQHYRKDRDKEVREILPEGYVMPWPGYLDLLMDRSDLVRISKHPEANRHLIGPLSASGGIYLIQHVPTGNLYVGSATGEQGIWARWKTYAATGHGGNVKLKKAMSEDPGYASHLRYSILHVLPRNLPVKELLSYESLYKDKLGSRAFGLNSN